MGRVARSAGWGFYLAHEAFPTLHTVRFAYDVLSLHTTRGDKKTASLVLTPLGRDEAADAVAARRHTLPRSRRAMREFLKFRRRRECHARDCAHRRYIAKSSDERRITLGGDELAAARSASTRVPHGRRSSASTSGPFRPAATRQASSSNASLTRRHQAFPQAPP
jgi:hypothetical protein